MSKPQGYQDPDPTFNSCLYCRHSIIEITCDWHECHCYVDFKPPLCHDSIVHDIEPLGYCHKFNRRGE